MIEDRTVETVFLFVRDLDGSEHKLLPVWKIGPHSRVHAGPCEAGHLVARDRDGRLISSRGPFDECNLDPWIIEEPLSP